MLDESWYVLLLRLDFTSSVCILCVSCEHGRGEISVLYVA